MYSLTPIGLQAAPIEFILAATGHVVAASILLNKLATFGTAFNLDAHKLFDVDIAWGCARFCGKPLMLTHEAHHRIESQVA
jgi:hypothetical protein